MKKYLSFAKYYICLLLLLGLGVYILAFGEKEATASETENRMLQAFPTFSMRAAADGSYMTELEAYLSDAFPARNALIGLSRGFRDLFSALPPEDNTRKAVEEEMGLTDDVPPPEPPSATASNSHAPGSISTPAAASLPPTSDMTNDWVSAASPGAPSRLPSLLRGNPSASTASSSAAFSPSLGTPSYTSMWTLPIRLSRPSYS